MIRKILIEAGLFLIRIANRISKGESPKEEEIKPMFESSYRKED